MDDSDFRSLNERYGLTEMFIDPPASWQFWLVWTVIIGVWFAALTATLIWYF